MSNTTAEQILQKAINLHKKGRLAEAQALYEGILKVEPRHSYALNLLGLIAYQIKDYQRAVDLIGEAIEINSENATYYYNYGLALRELKQPEAALASYDKAIVINPGLAEAYCNRGIVLQELKEPEAALTSYDKAISLRANYAEAYCNRGIVLQELKEPEAALMSYDKAIAINPVFAEVYYNRGRMLEELHQLEAALMDYDKTIALKPDYAEAYYNCGNILKLQNKLEEAAANYQRAIAIKPDYVGAYNNLGIALQDQDKMDEAAVIYQHAIHMQPDYVEAYHNLGTVLYRQGKINDAIEIYRQAWHIKPDIVKTHDVLVVLPRYSPDYDSAEILKGAKLWNEQHAAPLARCWKPHTNSADPERRLRIGYVSPDFRNHAVAHFLLPLLSNHDHSQVEIFCYAEVVRPDEMTERLRTCADTWRVTVGLSDEQMAEMIRQDGIDILVDLALHSNNNRLLVFAHKPAPVQVTWLGYPGTTGMTAIDYRLTDPYLDPPGADYFCYTEESVHLPHTFWCYDPLSNMPMAETLPALKNGFVTFGCTNGFYKVNDSMLKLWAKILNALPKSQLMLFAPRGKTWDRVYAMFREEGIDASRLHLTDRLQKEKYMQVHNWIDICLDTWPCCGGTTTLDALWMGVPMITLLGKTIAGRSGFSILSNIGLQELVAHTPEEYLEIAVKLAKDLPRLQTLRANLRERMRTSPLMDGKRFASDMEQTYRQMWRRWCKEGSRK